MSEPRPKYSPEIALAAAKELAADLAKEDLIDPGQVDSSAQDIAEYARSHMDGYEIARQLEKFAWWECDLRIAETLDGWSHTVDQHIAAAEKAWAERNNVQPPVSCGSRVSFGEETGTITEVYKYGAAKYCIAVDGDPDANSSKQTRRIVNFEDVSPL